MSPSSRQRRALFAALGALAIGVSGCQAPGASRIVGPDGSAMAHVHCGSDQGACFRLAGELCPSGYELKPVLSGNDGNFLVRCRSAAAVAQCPAPASPAPQTSRSLASSSAGWPPSSEPWPAAYPWPPPETTAGVRETPAPSTSQEIDLGY